MKTRFGWALASAMLLGGIGSASAADMAVKAPPMAVPPPCVWCGFYVGVNGGGAWTQDHDAIVNETFAGAPFVSGTWPGFGHFGNLSATGGFGGGQIGYNWQTGRVVFGLEADIQGADIRGSTTATITPYIVAPNSITSTVSERIDWFGTVRGRIGYAWDRTMLYATGGFAYGDARTNLLMTDTFGFAANGSNTTTRTGYTVGAGAEFAFSPKWSVKAEYQYIDLGRQTVAATEFVGGVASAFAVNNTTRIDFHTVRVGLNYHFGGPVVAKY